jgi:hypothetical protein
MGKILAWALTQCVGDRWRLSSLDDFIIYQINFAVKIIKL